MKAIKTREIDLGHGVTIHLFQGIRLHVWPTEKGETHFSITREASFLRRRSTAKKKAGRPPSAGLLKLRAALAKLPSALSKDQLNALAADYALTAGTSRKVATHAVRRELARRSAVQPSK